MYIFKENHYKKVLNYISSNLYSEQNISSLLLECEKFGELILIGGSIKDIAFFNKIPKDFDIVVLLNNNINDLQLEIDENIYDINKNSFGGYKVKYENYIFDIWSCNDIKDIENNNIQFNLDGLYINLSTNKYYTNLFNEGIRSNVCKIVNNKISHPSLNRDYERGLQLAERFKIKYEYKEES